MPTSSIFFTPSRRKNHGIAIMKNTSDICPSQDLLRGEEAVGNQPDEERRHHGGNRGRAEGEADLLPGEPQRLSEPRAHRHGPRPPDEVLEEHQRGKLESRLSASSRAMRVQPWCSRGTSLPPRRRRRCPGTRIRYTRGSATSHASAARGLLESSYRRFPTACYRPDPSADP